MPAEWAEHEATWISWPHNVDTWPERRLAAVEEVMAEAVRLLSGGEKVYINVLNEAHEEQVRSLVKAGGDAVRYFHIPTNDAWCRDHGPTFVLRMGRRGKIQRVAIDWTYNGWGEKYPPFGSDARAAGSMASAIHTPRVKTSLVAEGGALEVNGGTVLLTTASCLLNPNRNPGWTKEEVENVLRPVLGVSEIIWLEGDLVGDDTDGHIDNMARFVNENTILAASADNAVASPRKTLREQLEAVEEVDLRIVDLPVPSPIIEDGKQLPGSYANFYIGNEVVLVPAFDDPMDDRALQLLNSFFPGRSIVGLPARDVVWGLGSFHCLTQQVPSASSELARES